jgi:hypothetical protein
MKLRVGISNETDTQTMHYFLHYIKLYYIMLCHVILIRAGISLSIGHCPHPHPQPHANHDTPRCVLMPSSFVYTVHYKI